MDDHFDLWKLPLHDDGTAAAPPQRAMPPGELDIRHVAIHPQGSQLAYVGMATVAGLRSLPLRRDGLPAGPSVRIAEDAVRMARRPSFSPDAGRVAFERQVAGGPPGVWLLDLATGAVSALTGSVEARDPTWSRDGSRVYFETGDDSDVVLQAIRVEDGATEVVARLADGGHTLLRPRVSPDGTRLAYTRSSEGQLEVWVRELAGGADARVVRLGDGAAFPTWSPDSRAVAVDVWRNGHAQAYVADLTTSAITQVSRSVDQAWVRSWSPDGTRLVFAGATDGRWNVWSVRRDGSELRQLTDYGDEHHYVRNPEWSPSGDRLVYEFATFSGNIWAVPLP
jgi:Tol biopolymer transport system component